LLQFIRIQLGTDAHEGGWRFEKFLALDTAKAQRLANPTLKSMKTHSKVGFARKVLETKGITTTSHGRQRQCTPQSSEAVIPSRSHRSLNGAFLSERKNPASVVEWIFKDILALFHLVAS